MFGGRTIQAAKGSMCTYGVVNNLVFVDQTQAIPTLF